MPRSRRPEPVETTPQDHRPPRSPRHPFRASIPKTGSRLRRWAARVYAPVSPAFYPFRGINKAYRRAVARAEQGFVAQALAELDIRFAVQPGALEQIPRAGALIVIANHPTGGIDGMLLGSLLEAAGRPRYKIMVMADTGLERLPELAPCLLPVDLASERSDAASQNTRALRACMRWLRDSEALIIFPAGGLPRRIPGTRTYEETPWKESVGRLVLKSKATVVPVYIDAETSRFYQWMGERHDSFRVGLLGEQIVRLRGEVIPLHVGRPLPAERVQELSRRPEPLIESLKQETLRLR